MMETQGYSLEVERAMREKEKSNGTDEVMAPRDQSSTANNDVGRPELDNDERTSDPDAAERGRQPKPSSPEGSLE